MSDIKNEVTKLLEYDWESDSELVERVVKNIVDYRKYMPKSAKDDVIAVIQLAIKMKKVILSGNINEQNT